jgi:cytochrome P450
MNGPVFDPLAADFPRAANEQFATMRRDAPVFRHGDARWPFISVFEHSTIRAALLDPGTWSSVMPEVERLVLGDAAILIQDDPPRHAVFRRLVASSLGLGELQRIGVDIEALAKEHWSRIGSGECDFIEDYAAALALEVVGRIIGLSASDWPYLREWTNRFADSVGAEFLSTDSSELDRQANRVASLHAELTAFLEDVCRASHRRGLIEISSAWPITPRERIGLLKSLAFAGNHTSSILQGNAVWLLARNPREFQMFRNPATSISSTVEEILRFKGTFRGITRIAATSGSLGGLSFETGDYLLLWLASGNRDDKEYESPNEFRLSRWPNQHLAFGTGLHHCVAAHVARLQLRATLGVLRVCVQSVELSEEPAPIADPWVDGFTGLRVRMSAH